MPLFPSPPPPPPMPHDPERAILVSRPLEARLHETVRFLADDVRVRRPGSLSEANAAGYVAGQLNRANQQATVLSTAAEHGLAFGIGIPLLLAAVACGLVAALPGAAAAVGALVVLVVALVVIWNEIEGRAVLGLLRARQQSQSVVGVRAPVGSRRRVRVVVAAPLDRVPQTASRPVVLFALQVIVVQALLVAAWLVTEQPVIRWTLALGTAALLATALVTLTLRARRASRPAIQGAGELAALVAIAEELGELQQVELWTVALGAVSMGDSGVRQLVKQYPFEPETLFINLHDLTSGQPAYVTREGLLREYRSDRTLLALASDADAADVSINAEPRQLRQRTLAALPLQWGYPTLTITTQSDQRGFTSADPRSLARCVRLVVGIIRELDRIG